MSVVARPSDASSTATGVSKPPVAVTRPETVKSKVPKGLQDRLKDRLAKALKAKPTSSSRKAEPVREEGPLTRKQLSERLGHGNYRKIARKTGHTPQHIGRVLKGENGTSLVAAKKIAKAAGVTLDELYTYIMGVIAEKGKVDKDSEKEST